MSDATITGAGIVADLQPYIIAAIGAVVTALGAVIAYQIRRYTGIVVDQSVIDKVDKYIADKAAQAVAAASDNLSKKEINVYSPIVADLTSKIIAGIPYELDKLGFGPNEVAHKLTSEFGRLQASMTATPIPPAKSDAAATVTPSKGSI